MSRRSDNKLRFAITEIEHLVFSDPSTKDVLLKTLNQLMILFDASFGYVYQCKKSEGEIIPWDLVACQKHNADNTIEDVETQCTSKHIPESLQNIFLSGRCFSNPKNDSIPTPLPDIHPKVNNFLCIPLVDARFIHAVFYICNATSEFEKHIEARIRPLLVVASCIIRASEKQTLTNQNKYADIVNDTVPDSIRRMMDSSFNPILAVNSLDQVVASNGLANSLFDPANNGLASTPLKTFFPNGTPRLINRLIDDSVDTEKENGTENHNVWKGLQACKLNGEPILFDMRSFKFTYNGQLLRGLVFGNISDEVEKLSDYHSILQRFQALTNMVPVGILQLNRNWECVYVNDTFCEYCHMSPEELEGDGWLEGIHPEDSNNALIRLRTKSVLTGDYSSRFRLQSPLGKVTWAQVSASPLYNGTGNLDGLILTFNDITDQLNNEKRLQDIAEKDQLTGLTNRAFFNDRVAIALKGAERFGKVALMFLDLDEFKRINDTFGHQSGDHLLRQVAQRLELSVRKADTIARIGGDEFTVLLTNIDHLGSVTAVAEKLISNFNQPFMIGKHSIYVTCSIGIVVTETGEPSLKTLLKQADIALYKAKELGRNQYKFYSEELDIGIDVYMQLKRSLKETSANDFHVVYQPQVDGRTGRVTGLEALTRWTGGNQENISPDVFIRIIENSGLINEFSEWLFNSVFKQVQNWNKRFNFNQHISISINLSAKQFKNTQLTKIISECCHRYGILPQAVILEMTETAIIEDPEFATKSLTSLRDAGFSLSLDDFGTGYSSLSYLRSMPFQCVKIDKSFVQDVVTDEKDAEIVSAVIALANKLNLQVIAEGVSSEKIKEWLIKNSCNIHQGFYFHKPLGVEKIDYLLSTNTDFYATELPNIISITEKL